MDPSALLPLGVVGLAIALAVVAEIAQWLIVYRTPAFKRMKANLERHSQKVDAAKDSTAAVNVKKRESRLQGWQQEAGKLNAVVQMKSMFTTGAMLLLGMKLVPAIFGSVPVAQLPFDPPGFIQKIAQRGLEGADAHDCSPMFLFMLCQGSLKIIVGKVLGWGPSRTMQEAAVTLRKSWAKQA